MQLRSMTEEEIEGEDGYDLGKGGGGEQGNRESRERGKEEEKREEEG